MNELEDKSGNDHDGTLTNMDPATEMGWALEFNGKSSSIELPKVLDRALTAEEIANLYAGKKI